MPVTKTAKRALRGSQKKAEVNKVVLKNLEVFLRVAKKSKSPEKIARAISQADRAAKKRAIHHNKAARIKSQLTKLLPRKAGKSKTAKKLEAKKA